MSEVYDRFNLPPCEETKSGERYYHKRKLVTKISHNDDPDKAIYDGLEYPDLVYTDEVVDIQEQIDSRAPVDISVLYEQYQRGNVSIFEQIHDQKNLGDIRGLGDLAESASNYSEVKYAMQSASPEVAQASDYPSTGDPSPDGVKGSAEPEKKA